MAQAEETNTYVLPRPESRYEKTTSPTEDVGTKEGEERTI